jgi:2-O-methyltransferase
VDDNEIKSWVTKTFSKDYNSKVFLDLGSHRGGTTRWLANIPRVIVHAVEPDRRNIQFKIKNVKLHREAIAAFDGECDFNLSEDPGLVHTASSSIRRPKSHLSIWPEVTFNKTIRVPCITLDSFTRRENIKDVSFIWADVQGAEGDMIQGGRETLARTKYMYTEVCPDTNEPWYEGQLRYSEILELLPSWTVIKHWTHDVLLKNRKV